MHERQYSYNGIDPDLDSLRQNESGFDSFQIRFFLQI